MTYRRVGRKKHACTWSCVLRSPECDATVYIKVVITCPVFLNHTRGHTHTQKLILLTEASGAAALTENPG